MVLCSKDPKSETLCFILIIFFNFASYNHKTRQKSYNIAWIKCQAVGFSSPHTTYMGNSSVSMIIKTMVWFLSVSVDSQKWIYIHSISISLGLEYCWRKGQAVSHWQMLLNVSKFICYEIKTLASLFQLADMKSSVKVTVYKQLRFLSVNELATSKKLCGCWDLFFKQFFVVNTVCLYKDVEIVHFDV